VWYSSPKLNHSRLFIDPAETAQAQAPAQAPAQSQASGSVDVAEGLRAQLRRLGVEPEL
jgi:hypothetical protein